jgi:hypothetical protein
MTLRESDPVTIDDDFFETNLLLSTDYASFLIDIDDVTIISKECIRRWDCELECRLFVFHPHEELSMDGDKIFRTEKI